MIKQYNQKENFHHFESVVESNLFFIIVLSLENVKARSTLKHSATTVPRLRSGTATLGEPIRHPAVELFFANP